MFPQIIDNSWEILEQPPRRFVVYGVSILHFKNLLPNCQHSSSFFIHLSSLLLYCPPQILSLTVNTVPSGNVIFVPNGTSTPLILSTAQMPSRTYSPLAVIPRSQYAVHSNVAINTANKIKYFIFRSPSLRHSKGSI